ncbi:MAG: hypothetical protein ACPG19_01880 [Saprospiraceae bacterium]
MRKMTIRYLFIISIVFIYSCEGGTTFSKIVDNKSTETITIKMTTSFGGEQEHTIAPNETKTIYLYDVERLFADDTYNCIEEFDSVKIEISNNKTLEKDFFNDNNWENESSGGRNSKEKCTFTVLEDDIQ